MSYLPCENPNCNSYGKPHPNCKCHGGMAEGGEAKSFCSRAMAHEKGCQFFAEGGEAAPDFIPDESQEVAPDFIPDEEHQTEAPDFIPDDKGYAQSDEAHGMETAFGESFAPGKEKVAPRAEPTETSLGSQAATVAEGVAQGLAGPLATLAETKGLGIPAEDIKERAESNPVEHNLAELASFATGKGEVQLVGKVGKTIAKALPGFGKLGAKVIADGISNGLIQAGDEVSKWMLGQGDPADATGAALAHTGIAAIIGGIAGPMAGWAGGKSKAALRDISESQLGQRAQYFLWGLGNAAKGEGALSGIADKLPGAAAKGFKAGEKFFENITGKMVTSSAGAAAGATRGWREDGLEGALKQGAEGALGGYLGSLATKAVAKSATKIMPAFLKVLTSGNARGAMDAFDHAANMAAGSKAIDKSIDHAFGLAPLIGQRGVNMYGDEKTRQKLDDWLEGGGIDQEVLNQSQEQHQTPGFAEGGHVEQKRPNGVETHYPEQNMLMNAARARISNYLNSQRPAKIHPKLAFDDEPDTKEQKRKYHKALDLAAQPLGILQEVKNGTIEPEDVTHFTLMHPELHGLLTKRITEKIVNAQMEEKKPPYKVRQGLSLLLGTPLSSELTPSAIQAAQQTFAQANAQRQQHQGPAPKKNTSKLSKSDRSFLTGQQALVERSQKA